LKTLLLDATVLGLAAAMNFPPAHAEGLKPSGRTTWPGISQRVDHSDSAVAALPASGGPNASGSGVAPGALGVPADPGATAIERKKEWQYHYVGRQPRWEGHWVLVEPPHAHLTQANERYPGPTVSGGQR
jgi:hypothetical protein